MGQTHEVTIKVTELQDADKGLPFSFETYPGVYKNGTLHDFTREPSSTVLHDVGVAYRRPNYEWVTLVRPGAAS